MLSLIVVASWCFCAKNFPPWISRQPLDYQKTQKPTCNLLLSKPRELSISAFFRSQTAAKVFLVGTSGPKGQVEFWQSTIWELSVFALWVREPPQVFIFPLLCTCTFTCSLTRCATNRVRCATNRVRGVAGILFRMASRQTATIATSCSIWPHEILAFTTSAFPSFYSSYILAHFHFFTVQSHATQLTALWADAVMWVTLPVILVFYGGGGGRVRCFCVGVCEGSCFNPFWEVGGPRLFSQKVSNIPRPIPPRMRIFISKIYR